MNKKQKSLALLLVSLTCISALLECIGVSAIIPLIGVIQNKDAIHSNKIIQKIPFFANADYNTIVLVLSAAIVLVYIIKNLYFILWNWVSVKFSCKMQRELSINILKAYMRCGYPFFLKNNIGYFSRGLEVDTANFNGILTLVFGLISDFFMSALICILLVFTDYQMALAVFAASLFSIFLMYFVFRRNMKKTGDQLRKFASICGQIQTQILQGIKDVIILRKQKYFIDQYGKNKILLQNASIKQTIGQNVPVRIIEAIFITIVIGVIGLKAVSIENPTDFVAKLAAFALGAFRMLPAIGRISSSGNGIASRLASIDSLCKTIKDSDQFATEHPELNFEKEDEIKNIKEFKNSLDIENITFRYNPTLETVLEDVSLKIEKGKSIAFIGQSGAGKSTLVDIILGLLIPEKGQILMDGNDITKFPQQWANFIGYIPQSVFLTDSSIRENIAFGVASKDIDDDLIEDVLKRTQLKEFIDSLPNGAETFVGDRGVRLSGGQRQRIAIARALYHRPQIMVLDEATSALDNETETAIMEAINALQGEVTLIIVAHRLTTVEKCDEIYEVRDKKLTKKTHQEIFGK